MTVGEQGMGAAITPWGACMVRRACSGRMPVLPRANQPGESGPSRGFGPDSAALQGAFQGLSRATAAVITFDMSDSLAPGFRVFFRRCCIGGGASPGFVRAGSPTGKIGAGEYIARYRKHVARNRRSGAEVRMTTVAPRAAVAGHLHRQDPPRRMKAKAPFQTRPDSTHLPIFIRIHVILDRVHGWRVCFRCGDAH